jgi:hypothetical protein
MAALYFAPTASAAPDDEELAASESAQDGVDATFRGMVTRENFDRWVYQAVGAGDKASYLESQLALQLDELERQCGLSADQRQKLLLAAAIDTKRFEVEMEVVREHFMAVKDQAEFQQIWQEINPLQQKVVSGLHDDKSFFGKSLRGMLSDEQVAARRTIENERRAFRYRAILEVAMSEIDDSAGLTDEQHVAIVKLALEETHPPKAFGSYDSIFVWLQLSKLTEAKVKALLNERQWQQLQRQIAQGRQFEQFLTQMGLVEP